MRLIISQFGFDTDPATAHHSLSFGFIAAITRQVQRVLKQRKELAKNEKPQHQFYTTGKKKMLKRALVGSFKYNAKAIYELQQ